MKAIAWMIVATALTWAPAGAQQEQWAPDQEEAMKPFPMEWRGAGASLVDLSGLLDRPAGAGGFVRVRDGHFVTPVGKRVRIWGVNLTGGACYPAKQDAAAYAERLASYGVNCVRLHFLDANWGKGTGIFPQGTDTTQQLDAAQLDLLDYFVAELKKRGVYVNINLNVGRVFRKGDGVADWEYLGLGKTVNYFDARVAELHAEYARQLLTHRNPYTGNEYRNEPAVMLVELVNENSIVESWFSGRLLGRQEQKNPGTWCDIPAGYAETLTRKFNDWLARRYPAEKLEAWGKEGGVGAAAAIPRLTPEQFGKASAERFAAEAAFYMELESAYFLRMAGVLKELGVRSPIVATADHNHWKSGYPLVSSTSKLDVVDGHVYWQHPRDTYDEKAKKTGFWIDNTPMVNDPLNSTVVQLARSAMVGEPFTVSEVNHPFPAEHACEGIAILAAYTLLQDWDGVFFYTFDHAPPSQWASRQPGHFDLRPDPVKMSQFVTCGAMFHRGDVSAARKTVERSYSAQQVVESLRMNSSKEWPLFSPGLPKPTPLVHGLRVRSFDRADANDWPTIEATGPIVSDTGELTWGRESGKGLVTIETDRTQAVIGFVGGDRRVLKALAVQAETPFCSIVLTSLDGKRLAQSGRMLLAAGGRAATTSMRWDKDRHTLVAWGKPPMRIDPVRAIVELPGRDGGAEMELIALDGAGAPLGDPRRSQVGPHGPTFRLDQPTVWYLLRAR